jgi:hypothetical protein
VFAVSNKCSHLGLPLVGAYLCALLQTAWHPEQQQKPACLQHPDRQCCVICSPPKGCLSLGCSSLQQWLDAAKTAASQASRPSQHAACRALKTLLCFFALLACRQDRHVPGKSCSSDISAPVLDSCSNSCLKQQQQQVLGNRTATPAAQLWLKPRPGMLCLKLQQPSTAVFLTLLARCAVVLCRARCLTSALCAQPTTPLLTWPLVS